VSLRGNHGGALRIGLTGPIGCGKSTVAGWLAEEGAVVIDADAVAREVTAPGEPLVAAIVARFGEEVAAPDGSLDRSALGRIVFADAAQLRRLEELVHPAVRPRVLARLEAADRDGARVVVIEAIKLVEGGLADLCDEVWLVTCDPAVQRDRVVERGVTATDAARRIAAQAGLVERVAPAATRVLDTSGDAAATRDGVLAALREAVRGRSAEGSDPVRPSRREA